MKNYFWNMFTTIRNGQLAKKSFIYQRKKNLCKAFLIILWNEGFIIKYRTSKKDQKFLKVFLKYSSNGKPIINNIKLLTKPGRRIFYSLKQIWKIDSNKTFIIFSTNKGLQTIDNCKKLKIGGEPFILIN